MAYLETKQVKALLFRIKISQMLLGLFIGLLLVNMLLNFRWFKLANLALCSGLVFLFNRKLVNDINKLVGEIL